MKKNKDTMKIFRELYCIFLLLMIGVDLYLGNTNSLIFWCCMYTVGSRRFDK